MKRTRGLLRFALAWLLLAAATQISQARAPQPALVFELASGRVLLAHDAGRPWYPASLTKLMTAWLVFDAVDRGKLSFDDEVTISPRVVKGVEKGAAKYGLKAGERMRIGRMLTFLLVRSDADMALALAEAVAGSRAAFVRRMNAAAARLGMKATHFVNPHGMFHPAQVTTARDMAVLARAIYRRFLVRHPEWWEFFSRRVVMKNGHKLKNRNHLLFMMPEANGMKTGFLCASGFNLLATARREGRLLGVVVFGRRSAYNRAEVARILLEEGFRRLRAGKAPGVTLAALREASERAPDLSAGICRHRYIPRARADRLGGWAVALGPFRNALRALGAAEAELIGADLVNDARLDYGITRLSASLMKAAGLRPVNPARKPRRRRALFAALVWRLGEREALRLCERARAHGTGCSLLSPAEEKAIARLLPRGRKEKSRARTPKPRRRPSISNIRPRIHPVAAR